MSLVLPPTNPSNVSARTRGIESCRSSKISIHNENRRNSVSNVNQIPRVVLSTDYVKSSPYVVRLSTVKAQHKHERNTVTRTKAAVDRFGKLHTPSMSLPDLNVEKRKFNMRLPSFEDLGTPSIRLSSSASQQSPVDKVLVYPDTSCSEEQSSHAKGTSATSALADNTSNIRCGVVPLLTPPADERDIEKWNIQMSSELSGGRVPPSQQANFSNQEPSQSGRQVSRQLQGLSLSSSMGTLGSTQTQSMLWITRAAREIINNLSSHPPSHQLQVASQNLPSQARDGRVRPLFEVVLETLQLEMEPAPYITITHAVPQVRVMEELPKTPPSTPNAVRELNDYFGGDQTIFTHAAVVPIYHTFSRDSLSTANRQVHHIAAPLSIHVSILERCIPPTMPEEVTDFFSLSSRSYLADRLSELSTNNGSLLLVYPTRTGGNTFTRKYIGPVLDPYLRQFIMLNGLTSDAAASMGCMSAVKTMFDFQGMKDKVEGMCQALTQRPAVRGHKSVYRIAHSESAEVILDRSTWISWYIEQELPRLRQNLVEYHQGGGRMPGLRGTSEVTVGMLVRELVDGIAKSKEAGGNVGIEVGVFVVTRLQT